LLVVLGISGWLVACGHSPEQEGTSSAATQPQSPPSGSTSTAAPAAYDISRVDNVRNDFPPGFEVEAHPAKALDQQDIDNSGVNDLAEAAKDPPQCRGMVIPPYANPSVGTEAAGVKGEGDQGSIHVVAFRSPQPIPVSEPPADCDRVALSGSPDATGTAERIPAPNIDGVTTTGAKLLSTDEQEDPEYIFTAALGDRTSVVVRGGADKELNPQQLMSDLLVKATAAVRGQ
jgi:hypothetical protein